MYLVVIVPNFIFLVTYLQKRHDIAQGVNRVVTLSTSQIEDTYVVNVRFCPTSRQHRDSAPYLLAT